ncbi:MAG: Tm-1-like ATP-binding domain-containing protein [Rhodothermales bacterium]
MANIVIIGALDTKGTEVLFVKQQIEARGHRTVVIDSGVLGDPLFRADVTRQEVASAGGADLEKLRAANDRGQAVIAMTQGAAAIVQRLHEQGKVDAIIGMGGGAGTTVGTAAMRALPLGIPKVMVSTLASGDTRPFVGVKDIMMVPSIVDISGLNGIARGVFTRAAAAVCGMVEADIPEGDDKPTITASMFGNTTKCVERARTHFEAAGYELLVFHAVGSGGMTMESLIESGQIAGVFDVTLTEWADELLGGVMSAGPTRLDAAARSGTPAVYAPGCVDIVNFWEPDSVPVALRDRRIYHHNAKQTLVRTDIDDNAKLGKIFAEKFNAATGPVAVYLPLKAVSVISEPGGPYHWPEADAALFDALRSNLRKDIPVYEFDTIINDPIFADAMAEGLLAMIEDGRS